MRYVITIIFFFAIFTVQSQKISSFRFTAEALGWSSDLVGIIDEGNKTITFTTQRWIEDIAKLRATFSLDGNYEVKVGNVVQTSGITTNDFRKDVVYVLNGIIRYTVKFLSPLASGLPVIKINTQNNADIISKTNYINMIFTFTDPNNAANNFTKTDMKDQIRGRGNDSWHNPNAKKKSYRIKFDKKTSLFGLVAAKSWVIHAQYRDATLLYNPTAFELGNRFNIPFNHSFYFVELYLNGDYKGNFLVTEHNQVNPGRVDIDENEGWMVEIDFNYDNDVKFRTTNYNLPVMVKSPDFEPLTINNPAFDFVRKEFNALTDAVASADFPDNGYRDLINMQSFIDYMLIQEITDNGDFAAPGSIFIYKDKNDVINMGPVWDFDCGYGYNYNYVHFNTPNRRLKNYRMNDFWKKLFEDPIFAVKYMERWHEKYDDIVSIPDFMNEMANMLEKSAKQNFQTWWYRSYAPWTNSNPYETNDLLSSVSKLKNWYVSHVAFLHSEINKVEAAPAKRTFYNYPEPQTVSFISYGEISDMAASFRNGNSSAFEIASDFIKTPTGNGGIFTSVSVKPKNTLTGSNYSDVLILTCKKQGISYRFETTLNYIVNKVDQNMFSLNNVPNKVYGDENFFLTTTGGSGNGAVTFNKISGNATIDQNTGEVEITGIGDILVFATKDEDPIYKRTQSQILTITVTQDVSNSRDLSQSMPLIANAYNNVLHVRGRLTGKILRVYTVTGGMVYHNIANTDSIDIPLKAYGIYIVSVGDQTVKVANEK